MGKLLYISFWPQSRQMSRRKLYLSREGKAPKKWPNSHAEYHKFPTSSLFLFLLWWRGIFPAFLWCWRWCCWLFAVFLLLLCMQPRPLNAFSLPPSFSQPQPFSAFSCPLLCIQSQCAHLTLILFSHAHFAAEKRAGKTGGGNGKCNFLTALKLHNNENKTIWAGQKG